MALLHHEKRTVEIIIKMYCANRHSSATKLCDDCGDLLDYALCRLDRCPFGEKKPSCSKCTIHCYRADMQTKIISVMKYSGPRMIFKHPVLALRHIIKDRKKVEQRTVSKKSQCD